MRDGHQYIAVPIHKWIADGCKAVVLSIDYCRSPVHPFPAAIEDTVAVWKAVIQKQEATATPLFQTKEPPR